MLLSYNEAIERYGSEYKLERAISDGIVFKQEEGVYSTERFVPELGVIMKKYPKAVLAGDYAFYMHGLTNVIPEKYDLATPAKAAKMMDARVHQIYVNNDIFQYGIEEKSIDGVLVRIYDKERMLIELLRNKTKMPYDLYKEIIINYREAIGGLEVRRILEYAAIFPKSRVISKALDEEVM
ncbi:MAG: hypothetical protein J5738_08005 [Lachnospiraceae bacterium]|nr:hypothetical protein [Lachnospiraceae bacterium]